MQCLLASFTYNNIQIHSPLTKTLRQTIHGVLNSIFVRGGGTEMNTSARFGTMVELFKKKSLAFGFLTIGVWAQSQYMTAGRKMQRHLRLENWGKKDSASGYVCVCVCTCRGLRHDQTKHTLVQYAICPPPCPWKKNYSPPILQSPWVFALYGASEWKRPCLRG